MKKTVQSEDNFFLDDASLELCASPCSWKCVSPFKNSDGVKNTNDEMFRRWMARHRHVHSFYEILLVLKGSALYGVDQSVFKCEPGTMVIIGPDCPHASRYRRADDHLRHIWISFITPKLAFLQFVDVRRGCLRRLNHGRSMIDVDGPSRLLARLESLKNSDAAVGAAQTDLLLTAFLSEIMFLVIDAGRRASCLIDKDVLLRKKVDIICEHIRKTGGVNHTLSDLAAVAGYSPSHLASVFKKTTGYTVHQYIDACRLERAGRLLALQIPLKTMAAELGFADKTTLSRWLNKHRRALR